jgi:hypothetical protein
MIKALAISVSLFRFLYEQKGLVCDVPACCLFADGLGSCEYKYKHSPNLQKINKGYAFGHSKH